MVKYYIDLDNTLCETINGDYKNSTPILQRIEYVNNLKELGNIVVIWTARGTASKVDYRELTLKQLDEWNIKYDELIMGKPDYDIYIDDKSFNVDKIWPVPSSDSKSKKEKSEIVPKGWGKEIIFVNNEEYCGKILCFNKDKKFSMHYHIQKKETWYVAKGKFLLHWIETENGKMHTEYLELGDIVTNERGEPHQVVALEDDSQLFEVSTKHYDNDSYRVWKGD